MHTPVLQFSNLSNPLSLICILNEIRASKWIMLDLKPRIPFSGHKFVGHSSWKRSNVKFGRSLCGQFASMAFSDGNGGFGKSDGSSCGKGNGDDGNGGFGKSDGNSGDDGEDANSNNLVGPWACGAYASKWAIEICGLLITFVNSLELSLGIVLPCTSALCILAAALCAYIFFYYLKWLLRGCEENASRPSDDNASSPPDDAECCICLSTYEGRPNWRLLPCNHYFHSSCINSWLRINPRCPICKQRCL